FPSPPSKARRKSQPRAPVRPRSRWSTGLTTTSQQRETQGVTTTNTAVEMGALLPNNAHITRRHSSNSSDLLLEEIPLLVSLDCIHPRSHSSDFSSLANLWSAPFVSLAAVTASSLPALLAMPYFRKPGRDRFLRVG